MSDKIKKSPVEIKIAPSLLIKPSSKNNNILSKKNSDNLTNSNKIKKAQSINILNNARKEREKAKIKKKK